MSHKPSKILLLKSPGSSTSTPAPPPSLSACAKLHQGCSRWWCGCKGWMQLLLQSDEVSSHRLTPQNIHLWIEWAQYTPCHQNVYVLY